MPVISYGMMPMANAFLTKAQFPKEYFFELAVAHCPSCKMFQLINQPDPKMMFHEEYAFFSGTSKKMAQHFEKKANDHIKNFIKDPKKSFVVELGSNDGIMLKHFAAKGIPHLGIEPSANVAAVAKENGVETLVAFFGEETARKVAKSHGQADIISAANVMCHIPDLASVGRGVDILLKPDGVFEFEDPYLGDVISKTSYDQFYDAHVYIFSVASISATFALFGLEVFHVEPQETHGGSMRYFLCRKGAHKIRDSVAKQRKVEEDLKLGEKDTYEKFAQKCVRNKNDLVKLLKDLKQQGKRIAGYAAAAKSTTVLNFCGIGPDLVDCIYDSTPIKQGKFSPGMHIPVVAPENFKKDYPDYCVVFAWNHAREILEKEDAFSKAGKKWILFCPKLEIV
jgi:methylation protein EvaC